MLPPLRAPCRIVSLAKMDQTPPPLQSPQPAPAHFPPPEKSGSGGKILAGCGIGCFVLVVLGVVVGFFMVKFTKDKLSELATAYVSDEPVAISEPQVTETEAQEVVARFDRFRSAMEGGSAAEALSLSDTEINALLFHHPDLEALAGRTSVRIEEDQLWATVSLDLDDIEIPFEFLANAVQGKYFNGEIALSLDTAAGRPAMYIEDLAVGGRPVPKQFLDGLRNENLLKEFHSDPKTREAFEKIRSLRIENDRLVIVPATTP